MVSFENFVRVLKKALSFNSQPTQETFPELPEVLIWLRCLLAILYGSFLGISVVRSGPAVLNILNLITFVPVLYCRFYLGVVETGYGGTQVIFSGTFNAFALALLLWIYFFTAAVADDEDKLRELLVFGAGPQAQEAVLAEETTASILSEPDSEF